MSMTHLQQEERSVFIEFCSDTIAHTEGNIYINSNIKGLQQDNGDAPRHHHHLHYHIQHRRVTPACVNKAPQQQNQIPS